MVSVEVLLNMIATEALEASSGDDFFEGPSRYSSSKSKTNLSPVQYNLELIRQPDGSLEWVE